jgi:hypothetical protein
MLLASDLQSFLAVDRLQEVEILGPQSRPDQPP